MQSKEVIIDFPLRGEWKALKSPGHHRFAYDFAAVGEHHKRILSKSVFALLLGRATVADSYSWSELVYSPISGRIIRAKDDWPDRHALNLLRDVGKLLAMNVTHPEDPDERLRAFAGNYVIIGSGGMYTFMAHLQQGSVQVEAEEEIRRGEQIGLVGNSGNTLGPHLHFQMMDGEDPLEAQIVAFRLRNYERWTGTEWQTVTLHTPEKGQCIRHAGT